MIKRNKSGLTVIGGFFVAVLALVALTSLTPVTTLPNPAQALNPPFDHSDCQYPDRWSNPADGCDNSDPAVPQCIKAAFTQEAEQACIAEYVKQYEQPAQSEPVTTTPASGEQKSYSCGGK